MVYEIIMKFFEKNKEIKSTREYKIIASGYKPLCFIEKNLLVYKQGNLYLMNTENYSLSLVASFNFSFKQKLISRCRILTRLFRMEPRLALLKNEREVYITFKGKIYTLNLEGKNLREEHNFKARMSSPLELVKVKGIKGFKNQIIYGEYLSNPNKEEINIYSKEENGTEWNIKYTFPKEEIEHIHSIVPDKFRSRVWILTGDCGDEAGIFYSEDDFKTVNKFLVGKQLYRSCVFIPQEEGIIYVTDSPDEDNSINFIDLRSTEIKVEKVKNIDGSCIYGTAIQDNLIFSTVVEPSTEGNYRYLDFFSYKRGKGIKSWNSELLIGNLVDGFSIITQFKKDILPMRLFQYGTMTFPKGKNATNKIFFYGNSLKGIDGKLVVLEFKEREICG